MLIWNEDEDRDGLQNVGFFPIQPLDPVDSPRELHYIQLPGKQQILQITILQQNFIGNLNRGSFFPFVSFMQTASCPLEYHCYRWHLSIYRRLQK
jgi:hypothetical protein